VLLIVVCNNTIQYYNILINLNILILMAGAKQDNAAYRFSCVSVIQYELYWYNTVDSMSTDKLLLLN